MVKLKRIRLPVKKEDKRINLKSSYLAKLNGHWYAGRFDMQWWGLNFRAVYSAGYQFDYPNWEKLYEIVEG